MRRLEAERKPERKPRDSMPPARDSINGFKPEPDNPHFGKVIKAKEKMKEGRFASAKKDLEEVLEAEPKNSHAISSLMTLYFKIKNIKGAEKLYDENRETDNIFIHNSMIVGYGKIGEVEKAEKIFFEIVNMGIADVYSCNSMMDIYHRHWVLDKAIEIFNIIEELGIATNFSYNTRIYICSKTREVEEAEKLFYKVIEIGMANSYTYTSMISVYLNARMSDKAENTLHKAIERKCDTPITYKKVICAYGNDGDAASVRRIYRMAMENGKETAEVENAMLKFTNAY